MPREPSSVKSHVSFPESLRRHQILLPSHFKAALASASLSENVSVEELKKAARQTLLPTYRLITHQISPPIPDIRAVADELSLIASRCSAITGSIRKYICKSSDLEDSPPEVLKKRIEASCALHPLVCALTDAASGNAGLEVGSVRLAEALLRIHHLGSWAGKAGIAFQAGLTKEKTQRDLPSQKSPARDLGFEIMRAYKALSGRPIRFSREVDRSSGKQVPSGPLFRFVHCVFDCARSRLKGLGGTYAMLAEKPEWSPAAETIAKWATNLRKADEGDCKP